MYTWKIEATKAKQNCIQTSRGKESINMVKQLLYFVLDMQVTQLTGFSDPVYAEAYININQYDIVLDVLIVNQTSDTLQNCSLELATLGKFG